MEHSISSAAKSIIGTFPTPFLDKICITILQTKWERFIMVLQNFVRMVDLFNVHTITSTVLFI